MIQLNTFSGEQVLECLLRYQSKSVRQCSRLNSECLCALWVGHTFTEGVRPRIEECVSGGTRSQGTDKFRGEVTKTVYAPGGVCAVQRSVCVLRVCTKEEVESEGTARVQECNAL